MELPKSIEDLQELTSKYIFSEDQTVSLILRTHLVAESIMDEMITAYLPKGAHLLTHARLSFVQKIELVYSFDVDTIDSYHGVKALNSLRNKLAHKVVESVAEEDILKLANSMGEEHSKEFMPEKDKGHEHFLEFILGYIIGVLAAERDNCLVNHSFAKSQN